MKPYLFFFVLLLLCTGGIAQIPQTHKIVYLKDGTNVKGTVTVNDSACYVMVVDHYNETHYYQKSMVAKIDDEPQHRHVYTLKPKGYMCNIEIGGTEIVARRGGTNLPALSFDITNSYLISPYASIGMGIGTELSGSDIEMFSLYAHSRVYFIKADISPFWDLTAGYNAMFANGYYGDFFPTNTVSHGMNASLGIGIRVAASKKMALTAGVSYKIYYLHNAHNYYTYNNLFSENADRAYSRGNALTFKLGFQF